MRSCQVSLHSGDHHFAVGPGGCLACLVGLLQPLCYLYRSNLRVDQLLGLVIVLDWDIMLQQQHCSALLLLWQGACSSCGQFNT